MCCSIVNKSHNIALKLSCQYGKLLMFYCKIMKLFKSIIFDNELLLRVKSLVDGASFELELSSFWRMFPFSFAALPLSCPLYYNCLHSCLAAPKTAPKKYRLKSR